MAYISNPNEISFNGESLRGFVIEEINDEKIEINDIEVKFQINRAIVFDIGFLKLLFYHFQKGLSSRF